MVVVEEYGKRGLSERQARELLAQVGENRLRGEKKSGAAKIFAEQFRDALILILLAATGLSVLMGEVTEAATILAIVFLNALLGFLQEYRTEKTLEKLSEMASPTASVLRDGALRTLDARLIVPGDVVRLQAGDRVPADGELLESESLSCDESMLSGESAGVEKNVRDPVHMGTMVLRGRGLCRVTATGDATEMGRIAGMLGDIGQQQTPLQKKLAQLSKVVGVGCLLICAVVAATGILRGEPVLDMLLTGISLSVAAVPEGLPAIVTIALALSVGRMVRQNALVRRLHAVETLGCASVICSDKTGTLTENRMSVQRVCTAEREFSAADRELSAAGGSSRSPGGDAALRMLLDICVVCSDAAPPPKRTFFQKGAAPRRAPGEPTEAALVALASHAGVSREKAGYTVEKENPFDSTRKLMSVLARSPSSGRLLLCKGAPDVLIGRCTQVLTRAGVRPLTAALRTGILEKNERMGRDALRVLGFGYRPASAGDTAEEGFIFVGLCGMLDPPRKEAAPAVHLCRSAHIRPVMITGDHAVTARAIAAALDIWREGDRVLTGRELDTMDDETLSAALPQVSVFARVTPAHKLRIVRALRAQGEIVAMTGDGVNDAPAVKEADIGVAMGRTGTDVTKEAASVILLDDNFATLVYAVEEGRVIYQNIRKFIRYLLSCNLGEVFTMFFAMLAGMPVPLVPIQILLVNLVTDGLPAVALGMEPPSGDVMSTPPRRASDSIFSGGLAFIIVLRGLLIGITTVAVFVSLLLSSGEVTVARTGALLTLVCTQLIHVFECKSETKGLFSINPFDNLWLCGAVLVSGVMVYLSLYNPVLAGLFGVVPLGGAELRTVFSYCLCVPLVSGIVLAIKGAASQKHRTVKNYPTVKNYRPSAAEKSGRIDKYSARVYNK